MLISGVQYPKNEPITGQVVKHRMKSQMQKVEMENPEALRAEKPKLPVQNEVPVMSEKSKVIASLTPEEKAKLVDMLARLIIERRKEREKIDQLKKI